MAKAAYYKFALLVEGNGRFPLDMLRYDSCVPATSADASACDDAHHEQPRERRAVRLHRFSHTKGSQPERARWASFGWRVVSDEPAVE